MFLSDPRRAAWLRATSMLLALSVPMVAIAEPLRAAAVTAGPPGREMAALATLARAAIAALDALPDISPLRAAALREALVPAATERVDPSAEAFALVASAPGLAAQNALAGAAIYERALALAFEKLPAEAARRFVDTHGAAIEKALVAAQRMPPALARRLRLWREPAVAGPPAKAVITVEPDDARVYLDGRLWPDAPRTAGVVTLQHEAGVHDLRVEKDGFVASWQAVTLFGATPAAEPTKRVVITLLAQGGTEDVVRQRVALDGLLNQPEALVQRLAELAKRLEVALVFLTTPDESGALVRLFDAETGAFAGASPVATSDAPTLTRAYRALLGLRATGTRLVESPRKRRRKRAGGLAGLTSGDQLWKKWWFWTLVVAGAGAITGAVLLSRDASNDGTLTIRLRRGQ